VRALPCRHIYHPECIDSFLLQNSSLCPVCKTTALPRSFCPDVITDTMVRQERVARRLQLLRQARERANRDNAERNDELLAPPIQRLARRLVEWRARNQEVPPTPRPLRRPPNAMSAPSATRPDPVIPTGPATPGVPAAPTDRQEEMRRRALAMLGEDELALDAREAEAPRSRSK
jgi:hypothetical protein